MRRLFVLLLFLLPAVVRAQGVTIPKTLLWDAPTVDATHGAASGYEVRVDGILVASPLTTSQVITFTSMGDHTITVVAVNAGGSSPPATLVYTVRPPAPTAPGNLRFTEP